MRIAYFHNWSWIGSAVGHALVETGRDELWLIGAPVPAAERDPELVAHAVAAGFRVDEPADVGAPELVDELARFAPDLILVGTFARKLSDAVLAVPSRAAINLHPSLLPAYRGPLPEFWALRNGDRETGITAHLMTPTFDAGPLVARVRVPIADGDDLVSLAARMAGAAPQLALDVLDRLRGGWSPAGTAQDEALVTRAPLPSERDLAIRWTEPAASIERLVRAARPRFAAHTELRGRRVIVRGARLAPGGGGLDPGELGFDAAAGQLRAGAGDATALALDELELEGGVRLDAAGFAHAVALGQGDRCD